MKLKNTVYKTIEVAEDEEYGMVVGNIVMDGNKMLYAEIVSGTICDHGELVNARAFLDEVEDAMTTNALNTSNEETEPIINEECVGCCKVVDIAAKLQKELDECNERCTKLGSHNMQITANILDQKAIFEDYKETIRVERIDRAAEKQMINRKFCEDLRKLNATIEELEDRNIEDLKEMYDFHEGELEWFKDRISLMKSNYEIILQSRRDRGDKLEDNIKGLEAELSARKEDSVVLEKVAKAVDTWHRCMIPTSLMGCADLIKVLDDILEDHVDSGVMHNAAGDDAPYTVEMGIRCE